MLDYQCYPIWIYDENGDFIDNDLVEEIKKIKKLLLNWKKYRISLILYI